MNIPSLFRRHWKEFLVVGLIFATSFSYLAIRARDVRGWDGWHFGSAQTLLTVRYWARDGMYAHMFFFLPSGYFRNIRFLDQPQFRFLADGTSTGQMIGNRVYYTHYPPGYIFPFGLLAMLGAEDRFWFRLLAITFSLGSAVFLYLFIRRLFNGNVWAAAIAIGYYVSSTGFLYFADSLANQPLDDFLRFAILAISFRIATKVTDPNIKKKLDWIIWILYLVLSFSSYDATFFLFVWFCGLDFIHMRKIRIATYVFWGLAPVIAFTLQIAQNVWYLGWHEMVLDFFGALRHRSTEIPVGIQYVPFGFRHLSASLSLIGYLTDLRTRFSLIIVLFLSWVMMWRMEIIRKTQKHYLFVLLLAAVVFPFLMPVAGTFGYQGRLMAPFLLPFIGIGTYEVVARIRAKRWEGLWMLVLPLMLLWGAHVQAFYNYIVYPEPSIVTQEQYEDWTTLGDLTPTNSIILATKQAGIDGSERFFAQFYADRLILRFENPEQLAEYAPKIRQAVAPETILFTFVTPDQEEEIRRLYEGQNMSLDDVQKNTRWVLTRIRDSD
jgi:hypothetical protein